jgi:hypothetical protein
MGKTHISRPWNAIFGDQGTQRFAREDESVEVSREIAATNRRCSGTGGTASFAARGNQDRGASVSIASSPAGGGGQPRIHQEQGATKWPRIRLPRICRLRLALVSGISALTELWPSG